MLLTNEQAYQKCLDTFRSWVNWQKPTDFVGLMLGLGDLYCEIRLLEDELSIQAEHRFNVTDYIVKRS